MAPAKRPICTNPGAATSCDSSEWRPTARVSKCAHWASECRGHFTRTSCTTTPPRVHTMMLGNGGELEYMYEPVTNTVLTGLRAKLHSHEIRELRTIIGQHGQTRDPNFPLRMQPEELLAGRALRAGDVFLWVGASGHDQVPWRALRGMGLYTCTIYYQSEPVRSCSLSRAEVDEIWDFSWSNIDSCVDNSRMPACDAPPVRRYVPLVPSDNPMALQYLSDPADSMPDPAPSLVFFGAPVFRQACLDFLSRRLKTRIIVQNKIWTAAAFEHWLASFETPPIFLNLHKGCQVPSARSSKGSREPITWRNPKLIGRGLLVISEPAYPKDEAEFEGLIDFAPLPALVERFHQMQAMSGAFRRKLALSRLHNFRLRFNASGVFARAGIYALLRHHRAHTRECTVDNSTPGAHRMVAPCCVFPRCLPASVDDTQDLRW